MKSAWITTAFGLVTAIHVLTPQSACAVHAPPMAQTRVQAPRELICTLSCPSVRVAEKGDEHRALVIACSPPISGSVTYRTQKESLSGTPGYCASRDENETVATLTGGSAHGIIREKELSVLAVSDATITTKKGILTTSQALFLRARDVILYKEGRAHAAQKKSTLTIAAPRGACALKKKALVLSATSDRRVTTTLTFTPELHAHNRTPHPSRSSKNSRR